MVQYAATHDTAAADEAAVDETEPKLKFGVREILRRASSSLATSPAVRGAGRAEGWRLMMKPPTSTPEEDQERS